MTVREFSDEFDVLLNSYAHSGTFEEGASLIDINLDEFEKSVFLTNAQEEIVKELYSGHYSGNSFESSEQLRRGLDYLVINKKFTTLDIDTSQNLLEDDDSFTHTSYHLPLDCLYIIYEQVQWSSTNKCINKRIADVKPVTHDEYLRIKDNSFRGPNIRRVLRLDKGNSAVELISKKLDGVTLKYTIRYIKKPEPIRLINYHNEEALTCKLNPSLHRDILKRAVQMALTRKVTLSNSNNGER